MRVNESYTMRRLGLLLIAACCVLALVPYSCWISTGPPPNFGWSAFFDHPIFPGPQTFTPLGRMLKRLLYVIPMGFGILAASFLVFRLRTVALALLTLASAWPLVSGLRFLGNGIHPAGIVALLAFVILSATLAVFSDRQISQDRRMANSVEDIG